MIYLYVHKYIFINIYFDKNHKQYKFFNFKNFKSILQDIFKTIKNFKVRVTKLDIINILGKIV